VLKLIDLDTVKREDDFQQSGTKGYVAPEVRANRSITVFALLCAPGAY